MVNNAGTESDNAGPGSNNAVMQGPRAKMENPEIKINTLKIDTLDLESYILRVEWTLKCLTLLEKIKANDTLLDRSFIYFNKQPQVKPSEPIYQCKPTKPSYLKHSIKHQPSSTTGTCSPPATPHRLKHSTACQISF